MKISQDGINLIKNFEGCRLQSYKDAVGVPTIGYGSTKNVSMGMTITQSQAENLLKQDLVRFENNVLKYNSKYNWNQNEFDALVSFAFNIGSIDQLTANGTRDRNTIIKKIPEYNMAGKKELSGLTTRRYAERDLFVKVDVKTIDKVSASTPNKYVTGTYIVLATSMNVRVGYGTNYRVKALNELTPSAQKQGGYVKGVKFTVTQVYQIENEVWGKTPSGWICLENKNGVYCKKF